MPFKSKINIEDFKDVPRRSEASRDKSKEVQLNINIPINKVKKLRVFCVENDISYKGAVNRLIDILLKDNS